MAQKISFQTIQNVLAHYQQHGYLQQQKELSQYTIQDVSGLVTGYTPYVLVNGQSRRIWCCSSINISQLEIIQPYVAPHPHQWWMKNLTNYQNKVKNILISYHVLTKTYSSFEDLYDSLAQLGITSGKLYLYDLARRIGHCLGIYPRDYVYLHEGALKGAEILHNRGKIKLPANWNTRVKTLIFNQVFPNVDSIDIENILCIYKESLKTVKI